MLALAGCPDWPAAYEHASSITQARGLVCSSATFNPCTPKPAPSVGPCKRLQVVQGLMQKLLLQLIAELQRLGAVVVAADHSSLILSTGKRNLTAAVG